MVRIFLGTILLLVLSTGCHTTSDNVKMNEVVSSKEKGALTPEYASLLSKHSKLALFRIDQSIKAIKTKQFTTAKSSAKKAQQILDAVAADVPEIIIKDQLNLVTKKLKDSFGVVSSIKEDLVPIYESLNVIAEYAPEKDVKKAKADLENATKHVEKRNQKHAIEKLQEVGEADFITKVYMPIVAMDKDVNTSLKLMSKNMYTAAKKTLESAEGKMQVYTEGVTY